VTILLVLQKPPNQLRSGIDVVLRIVLLVLGRRRQEHLRLDVGQGRRHHQVLTGEVDVQTLHQHDVLDVLLADERDGDVPDVDLVLLDQVQQQVQRALEGGEHHLVDGGGDLRTGGGRRRAPPLRRAARQLLGARGGALRAAARPLLGVAFRAVPRRDGLRRGLLADLRRLLTRRREVLRLRLLTRLGLGLVAHAPGGAWWSGREVPWAFSSRPRPGPKRWGGHTRPYRGPLDLLACPRWQRGRRCHRTKP